MWKSIPEPINKIIGGVMMSKQYMFYFDMDKCIECRSCQMACYELHGGTGIHYRTVKNYGNKGNLHSLFLSISCNHCVNPVCVTVCPENNYRKRQDGIVILDSSGCKECLRCVSACPFQAPKINPITKHAEKCDFCFERLDNDLKPFCIENCPTNALNMVKVDCKKDIPEIEHLEIPLKKFSKPSIYLFAKRRKTTMYLREGEK